MPNPNGFPVWYELRAEDPDAASAFYAQAVQWTIGSPPPGGMDYRMIAAPDGNVGGLTALTDEMKARGAKPDWRLYIGVDDVDSTAERVRADGGQVLIEPWDLAGVGRMSVVADPQGIPFTIMRGAHDAASTAFAPTGNGHCSWNELASPDLPAAKRFYEAVFGWTFPTSMPMGEAGEYAFVHVGEAVIGGAMNAFHSPPGWLFYFGVDEIGAALNRVTAGGGMIQHGPVEVPGGSWIIVATDPAGTRFGLVGPYENDVE